MLIQWILKKKMFAYEPPVFEGEKPSKDKVKQSFIYFGNKFMEEMQGLSSQMRALQSNFNQQAQEMAMFNLLVCKMKVEDLLFIKFSITEPQVRYLLIEYQLHNDYEVREVQAKIASFEEMMG